MARPLRIEYEGALYHVTARGNCGHDVFRDDADRELFLETLAEVVDTMGWHCYAYCLMNNHYHLVIETPEANLGRGMRQLGGIFTQAINRKYGHGGHLFQGRYKAIVVESERFLGELVGHVLRNPVASGLVEAADAWPWSSARNMLDKRVAPEWMAMETLLSRLPGSQRTARKQLIAQLEVDVERPDVWRELNRQVYLGSDVFVADVQKLAGINHDDRNIPKAQRRPVVKSLAEFAAEAIDRNAAIVAAYQTGAYSYSQIGDYFGLYFTTVGRIVRDARLLEKRGKRALPVAKVQKPMPQSVQPDAETTESNPESAAGPKAKRKKATKKPVEKQQPDQRQLSLI